MQVNYVRIRLINKGNLIAKADVYLNNVLEIKGFSVFRSKTDGALFVMPPSSKYNGKYYDHIRINKKSSDGSSLFRKIEENVILAVNRETAKAKREDLSAENQSRHDMTLDNSDISDW